MLVREHPRDDDVLQHSGRVHAEALGDGDDAVRPEGPLRVDVGHLARAAAHLPRELGGDTESVADLSLASPAFDASRQVRNPE
eukprot:1896284-Pyramimonas_sp.AAC.2